MKEHGNDAPLWQVFIAGSAGGFANTVVGHPLDTVKVDKLISQNVVSHLTLILQPDINKVRLQTGNDKFLWKGLYSGIGSRMAGVVPDWIACYCGDKIGKRIEYPDWVSAPARSFGAGCLAGFLGGLILCPFDAVKM